MNQNTFKVIHQKSHTIIIFPDQPDMRVEIRHVRRRQLAPFLPDEIAKTIKTTKDKAKKVCKYFKGRVPRFKNHETIIFFQKSLTNKSIQPPQTSVVEEDMKDASKDKENNPNVRFYFFN